MGTPEAPVRGVRVTWAQARILRRAGVPIAASYDTTGRERWWRWYAPAPAILTCSAATPAMRRRAQED